MRRVDPTTLYESKELKEILRDVVNIETLRRFGLIGSPGKGYWGKNVVDSLNNYWDNLARQREDRVGKEKHLDSKHKFYEKQVSDRPVHPEPRTSRPVESERERFRRQVPEN